MGLEFCESWTAFKAASTGDATNAAIINARWNSLVSAGGTIITDSRGNYYSAGASSGLNKTVSHHAGFTLGLRLLPQAGQVVSLANNAQNFVTISVNSDGTMNVITANNVATDTTNASLHVNKWYYLELSMALTGSTNINMAYEFRVNGETLLSTNHNTGLNNINFPSQTTTANVLSLQGGGGNAFRDIYLNNTSGAFDGDVIIEASRPDSDVVTNWVTSSGTTHYTLVNENYSDFDTTYVYTTATGSQDIYTWQDIPSFNGIIQAIQISFIARKDDEGSKVFEIVTGTSGTETHSPQFYLSDDYIAYFHCQDTDPATGTNWTVPGFNNKDFGIKAIL